MDRDAQQDWSLLQKEALHTVRAGAKGSQLGFRVAQFVTLPSFAPCDSLDILRVIGAVRAISLDQPILPRMEPDHHLVVRTRWRMDIDEQKLETPLKVLAERFRQRGSPKPTIETETRHLSTDRVEAIRQRLLKIAVPLPLQPPSLGADGTSYELRIGSYAPEMVLCWWCDAPPGWKPLTTAFHEIVAELDKEFAS